MLSGGLHPLRRDRPDLRVKVDLRPTGAERFAGSPGRKDSEFQRHRGDGLALT